MVESSDKTWSTGEGNGKPLQYSCLENPTNNMKRQKDGTLKDELPKLLISDQCKEIEETNRMGKTRDLFKKIRDTKGTLHAKMGSIKDRNGMT